jgi:predicted esterase
MSEKKKLLKLLMLHGYKQNEKAFRERTGSLRKILKNHVEFIFCEAPHQVPMSPEENQDDNQDLRGWWFSSEKKTYDALDSTDCELGFDQTLEYVNTIFKTQGPFDGIFAFSQGACLGSILCRISTNNFDSGTKSKYEHIKFKFAILVAGFKSGQTAHSSYFNMDSKLEMPTIHVIGNTDKVIPCEMSESLTTYFMNPRILRHEGGHFIPVNSESKSIFVEFLNEMKSKLL